MKTSDLPPFLRELLDSPPRAREGVQNCSGGHGIQGGQWAWEHTEQRSAALWPSIAAEKELLHGGPKTRLVQGNANR